MNEITLVKKQVQEAEWTERIRQCRESGMKVTEWCSVNSINPKTYYYHLRKLRMKICEQIPVPVMTVSDRNAFVKISIGDVTAEFPEGTSEDMMTAVIRAMKNA